MTAFGSAEKLESLTARRELSEAAKTLLADPAFGRAYLELRQLWFSELMECPHAGDRQTELAARLRALEAIPNALSKFVENYRIDAQKAFRHAS